MSVRVLFFASLADIVGTREIEIPVADGSNVIAVFERLVRDFPRLDTYRTKTLCSINSEFARLDTPIQDGDEVAFFPPVSGG